jgi:tRNA-dihydrouridine synthase
MKLALAPMATLSHEALRILIHRWGDPDEYFSEMIHAPSFVRGGRFEPWYVRTGPSPERMVWQLTGSEAESMSRAAGMLLAYGGIGLDLNMGCSAPDIARSGAGIAWMSKPREEVANLVSRVRAEIDRAAAEPLAPGRTTPSRLGVKLRLGESEDYDRLLRFCQTLVESGADMITLHPRVRRDKYGRPARRAYVARLVRDLPVPVYGNGDIASAADALEYARGIPCAGLMIGRAAVQKPWIFREARLALDAGTGGQTPSDGEGLATMIDHLEVAGFFLENLARSQPDEFQISRAHRFFFYYCDNFSFAHHIKMKIQNAETTAEILPLLEEYFDRVPADRFLALGGNGSMRAGGAE